MIEEEFNKMFGINDEHDCNVVSMSSLDIHDANDMPLSTLIENNNESMDVNFVGRNNFGNNTYRGNFNPRPS